MTSVRQDILEVRGVTADSHSVTIVTGGEYDRRRVASFAGSDINRARAKMANYHQRTGRHAWLVRGTEAALLPFADKG